MGRALREQEERRERVWSLLLGCASRVRVDVSRGTARAGRRKSDFEVVGRVGVREGAGRVGKGKGRDSRGRASRKVRRQEEA